MVAAMTLENGVTVIATKHSICAMFNKRVGVGHEVHIQDGWWDYNNEHGQEKKEIGFIVGKLHLNLTI